MLVTPGIIIDGELVTTDLVEINLGMRILLGSSFYQDWEGGEIFVKEIRWKCNRSKTPLESNYNSETSKEGL